ncbi:hypothetical protein [Clostridium hydrogeniformans]|uniref:hypothetical protein n=1 Tax=Clostridium hydrogeniformans TaxID=349933 RepID=UPI000480DCF0|nr:hypothetical protein [Clostridium hydrogeniformans]
MMKIVDSFNKVHCIINFLKKSGTFILTIIGISIYLILNTKLVNNYIISKNKDMLIGEISFINMVIILITPGLILLLIYIYIRFRDDLREDRGMRVLYNSRYNEVMERPKIKVKYHMIFGILILSCVLLFIYAINSNYVIYEDKIEKKKIFSFKEREYEYKDINEVIIGAKKRKSGGSFYYKIKLKDGDKIDLGRFTVCMENELETIQIINNIIRKNNIERKIDKTYFHRIVEDLDKKYVREYENLFKD